MRRTILPLFIMYCFQLQITLGNQMLEIPPSIKRQITETVVPSYCTAYTTLNEHIVQKLLQLNVSSSEESVQTLVDSLLCAAKYVQQELQIGSKSIEQICSDTDAQITQLVLSVGEHEANVRQSEEAVSQANVNLQNAQQQVSLAQTAVHDAQHSLNAANQEVHDAHRAVERARHCGIGRRRKRFLGDLKKITRRIFVKPICSVVNSGGIDRAKGRRGNAEQTLHHERNRLQTHQQTLAQKQTEHSTAQTRLQTANIQLQTTTIALEQQRNQKIVWTNLLEKFNNIDVHLATVLSSSNVLVNEIANLIDFETVISPLNNIYNVMLENHLMIPFGFEISSETTAQITANLEKLSESLPNMPLHNALETESNVNVLSTQEDTCNFSAIKQQCSAHLTVKTSEISISTTTTAAVVPVHRYHAAKAHFYTTNTEEIGTTEVGSIGKYGYKYEGVGFNLLSVQLPTTVPFYRYGATAYSHFYTTNWQEIGTNIAGAVSNGFKCEGIIGYVYLAQQTGTCPLYRYLHTSNSQHFYTIHPCEIRTTTPGMIGRHSYKSEGVAAYVPTTFPCPQDINAC